MATTEARKPGDFYTLSHWGCNLFLLLVTFAMLATVVYSVARLLQPVQSLTGTIGPLEEARGNNGLTTYAVTLRTAQDELVPVNLRNNGRIFRYLSTVTVEGPVMIHSQRGQAVALIPFDDDAVPVRESRAPGVATGLVIIGAALLLLIFMRPDLLEQRLPGYSDQEGEE